VLWNQIVTDHGQMLYRAAYFVLRDNGDAEDVVQDVLVEAYRKHQANGTVPEVALLRRMATLRAIDRLRQRRRLEPIEASSISDLTTAPDRATEREEQADRLRRLIAQLPPRQSKCFVLRHIEGMTHREVAEALGISVSAVSTATYKARSKLRVAMSEYTGSEKPS
jgi:RNA polymerase sigma-70 factor (ECF subfamily)